MKAVVAKMEPCIDYLCGFCPKGDACSLGHPKGELPEIGEWSERFDAATGRTRD